MRTEGWLIVAGLMVTILAGCQSPGQRGAVIDQEQVQAAAFYTYWEAQVPLREGDAVDRCYLVDDNLYATSVLGDLFAIQADKGLLRWGTKLTEADYEIYPPHHLDTNDGTGPVVIVTTNTLHIRDRYSGDPLVAVPMPFAPGGGAIGDATRLFAGSSDGHVYSLLWRNPCGVQPVERWRLLAGGPVTSTPVLVDGVALFFTSQSGYVVCCTAFDKLYRWAYRTEGPVFADPVVDDSGVYIASSDRSVYRLNLNTGQPIWRYRFPRPLSEKPVVAGGTCYQHCPGLGLTAIDIDTGEAKWQREDLVGFAAAQAGEVVVRTDSGTIDVVDNETGTTKRSFDARRASVVAVNTQDEAVYLASADGRIVCIQPEGVPYLRQQEVAAAKAYLNRSPQGSRVAVEAAQVDAHKPAAAVDPFRSARESGQ